MLARPYNVRRERVGRPLGAFDIANRDADLCQGLGPKTSSGQTGGDVRRLSIAVCSVWPRSSKLHISPSESRSQALLEQATGRA